ncbi:hypothetical protein Q5P01_012793 [Channa striata]|uniref:Uncharacterized protein n=1 Tax=Channa striata TaxID=64152 RepID=A0AA88MUD5_CHASR|nr:hypothetical protein Q5P01_012793 [Channa striata]
MTAYANFLRTTLSKAGLVGAKKRRHRRGDIRRLKGKLAAAQGCHVALSESAFSGALRPVILKTTGSSIV